MNAPAVKRTTEFRIVVALMALLWGGLSPATAQDRTVADAASARESLFRTDLAWAAAASAGKDAEHVASFWADDGVIVPAGAPVVAGKAAIREFVAASFAMPGFHITWSPKLEDVHVSADGTMGYSISDSSTTFPGADGKLVTLPGRGVSIWRREQGGEWKCTYDIWNNPPAP